MCVWGELHIDLVGEGGTHSSKEGRDFLNISIGRGLLTQIFILFQTTSCYPVKNRYVAGGSKSKLFMSFCCKYYGPPPTPPPFPKLLPNNINAIKKTKPNKTM